MQGVTYWRLIELSVVNAAFDVVAGDGQGAQCAAGADGVLIAEGVSVQATGVDCSFSAQSVVGVAAIDVPRCLGGNGNDAALVLDCAIGIQGATFCLLYTSDAADE